MWKTTLRKVLAVVLGMALAAAGAGLLAYPNPARGQAPKGPRAALDARQESSRPREQDKAPADEGKDDSRGVSVRSMPPVVVRTVPQAGDMQVDARKTTEIRVTFSKEMKDRNWSWVQISDETFPKMTGKPHYDNDRRTCVLPVRLEPGKTYVIWLNSAKFENFKDAAGQSAVPYLLVFQTSP